MMGDLKLTAPNKNVSTSRVRFVLALIIAILASAMIVASVLAAAPAEGVVVEGTSVPGIALGSTRAQVEAAYGEPRGCQDTEVRGDLAFCFFPVENGGTVSVWYEGADGRYATNSPDDVVVYISWSTLASGWTTTAGVNTILALDDRQAVADAYPNADVTYDGRGNIIRVEDTERGVLIRWSFDSYTHSTHVSMAIYSSLTALTEGSSIRVSNIDWITSKTRGRRQVRVVVLIQDEQDQPVSGATVSAAWEFPSGSVQSIKDVTSNSGYAFFELNDIKHGTYILTITDVLLDGHPFDSESSQLSASIYVK